MNRFLVYIATNNDSNGNARRGWIEYDTETGEPMVFHNESDGGLPKHLWKTPVSCRHEVTTKEYNSWKRFTKATKAA